MNRRAVIDVPLRLIIALIIVSITIPQALGALRWYNVAEERSKADALLVKIAETCRHLYLSGVGARRSLHVGLSERLTENLILGGKYGSGHESVVSYVLKSGYTNSIVLVEPEIRLHSPKGEALQITRFNIDIMFEHVIDAHGDCIEVSIVD